MSLMGSGRVSYKPILVADLEYVLLVPSAPINDLCDVI